MRAHFAISDGLTYLNTGSMSFTPSTVLDAVHRYKTDYETNPTDGLFAAWSRLWDIQKVLARFFNADPRELFLRTNVTYAINDFVMALELPRGSEILVSSLEYGAIVNICRWKAESEGHALTTMTVPLDSPTEAKLLEGFERALTPKTKLVMISHVATANGLVFPIEKMAEIARRKGVILAVDGAHSAGSLPLDFGKTQVDFYASNLHKWMMGPKGIGFGWVAKRVREHLKPRFAGWTAYDPQPHYAAFGEGDSWTCRWMICSTHNFSDFYAIPETLKFWTEHDRKKIFSRQRELRDHTARAVADRTKWKCLSVFPEALTGPLVAFAPPKAQAQKGYGLMYELLRDHRIQVSMTKVHDEWVMRLSPHVYNDVSEIDRAAEVFSKL